MGDFSYCLKKLSARGVYFGPYGNEKKELVKTIYISGVKRIRAKKKRKHRAEKKLVRMRRNISYQLTHRTLRKRRKIQWQRNRWIQSSNLGQMNKKQRLAGLRCRIEIFPYKKRWVEEKTSKVRDRWSFFTVFDISFPLISHCCHPESHAVCWGDFPCRREEMVRRRRLRCHEHSSGGDSRGSTISPSLPHCSRSFPRRSRGTIRRCSADCRRRS